MADTAFLNPPPPFTPVPVRARRDGWTPEIQTAFIAALAQAGSVPKAARAVGRTPASAYRLRARPGAESFGAAWDTVVGEGRAMLLDTAFELAVNGEQVPVIRRGRIVGTRTRYDNGLLMKLIKRFDVIAPKGTVMPVWQALQRINPDYDPDGY